MKNFYISSFLKRSKQICTVNYEYNINQNNKNINKLLMVQ